MRNTIKCFGVIALVTVIGFSFSACDTGNGGGGTGGNTDGNTTVTLIDVTPSGSPTTTELLLRFSQSISGLSASDITLSGVSGVSKGSLNILDGLVPPDTGGGTEPDTMVPPEGRNTRNSETTYALGVSGFTAGGSLNVAVAKSGFTISGSPKTVSITHGGGSGSGAAALLGNWRSNNSYTLNFTSATSVTYGYPGFGTQNYSVNGNTIIFAGGAGGTASFSVSGNTLTVSNPTGTLAAAVASGSPFTRQ